MDDLIERFASVDRPDFPGGKGKRESLVGRVGDALANERLEDRRRGITARNLSKDLGSRPDGVSADIQGEGDGPFETLWRGKAVAHRAVDGCRRVVAHGVTGSAGSTNSACDAIDAICRGIPKAAPICPRHVLQKGAVRIVIEVIDDDRCSLGHRGRETQHRSPCRKKKTL